MPGPKDPGTRLIPTIYFIWPNLRKLWLWQIGTTTYNTIRLLISGKCRFLVVNRANQNEWTTYGEKYDFLKKVGVFFLFSSNFHFDYFSSIFVTETMNRALSIPTAQIWWKFIFRCFWQSNLIKLFSVDIPFPISKKSILMLFRFNHLNFNLIQVLFSGTSTTLPYVYQSRQPVFTV